MTLVDTSVWIACLRTSGVTSLEPWLPFDEAVTCLPVVQEVLQGIGPRDAYRDIAGALWALPTVEAPMGDAVYRVAIDLYRRARARGRTIRSSVDCLVAACALRHDLEVLHTDRDYKTLAKISGLRERSVRI